MVATVTTVSVSMALVFMLSGPVPTVGNAFLKATPQDKQMVAARAVEEILVMELAVAGRSEHMLHLQEELQPMFAALPKNGGGKLDAAVVRYGLHRFFVQARGWYIQGLQSTGEGWNASSPAELIKDRVPHFIQSLLEERVRGAGLGLQDLAAFAATIEHLIHAEAVHNLMDTFVALELPLQGQMSEQDFASAIQVYLMGFLLGANVSNLGAAGVAILHADIEEVYPAWREVHMWAKDLQSAVADRSRRTTKPFSSGHVDFDGAATFAEELGRRFGSFQDQECRGMKNVLVDMEHRGTGRVLLSDFYSGGLGGHWQFAESADYLRALGALDESNPRMPSVIIANYVGSPSNCLASSSFYSVCCMDECEGLMGKLERAIGEPTAEPGRIVDLVANLSSDTVDAPRSLSPALVQRLGEIANHHGGRVPLHGRLFAQFMHHAYPRECPFPHGAGTTKPMTPDEWMNVHSEPEASEEEIARHIAAGRNLSLSDAGDVHAAMPWSSFEELVAMHEPATKVKQGSVVTLLTKVALLAAVGGLAMPLVRAGASDARKPEDKLQRCLV